MGKLLRSAGAVAAAVAVCLLALAGCTDASVAPGAAVDDVASANLDDFTFSHLDVDYTLGRTDEGQSTLEVVERFVAEFPDYDQNHGMRRSIPDHYLGIPLNPQFVSITDGDGHPRAAEVSSEDGTFTMTSRADDFVHGEQVYVFTYTLENVTRFFADTGVDEFYWNVNGTEWAQPFGRVTATLHVDSDLAAALTGAQACYQGYSADSDSACPIDASDNAEGGADVSATADALQPFQTMTIAVAFEKGTFAAFDDSYLASPWGWLQGLAVIGVIGGVAWALLTRNRRLRDAPGRPTIIAEYTPPAQVDALQSAVMLGLASKAIPAEVLEQAVVGSIRIVEGEHHWFGGTRLKAQLVDPTRADGDGRLLLAGLFPGEVIGDEYEFGRSDRRLSTTAQVILKAAEAQLQSGGLRRPVWPGTRAFPILLTYLCAVGVVLAGISATDAAVQPWLPLGLIAFAVLAAIAVTGLVAHKPLTALGAEVRDHLAGLKVFIEWAEADRIRMLQSPQGAERVPIDTTDSGQMLKLYEVLLPYAVVFGQERQWAQELAVLYADHGSPGWYSGSSGFNVASFSAGISTLSASASSSSSTSGGSSGGGGAGGGGGGGGGGGV